MFGIVDRTMKQNTIGSWVCGKTKSMLVRLRGKCTAKSSTITWYVSASGALVTASFDGYCNAIHAGGLGLGGVLVFVIMYLYTICNLTLMLSKQSSSPEKKEKKCNQMLSYSHGLYVA